MLKEVRILPTLVYFYLKNHFGYIFTLRSRLAMFSALRACLALFSAIRGRLAWVKMTLIAVLRPICGWFCVLICGCV